MAAGDAQGADDAAAKPPVAKAEGGGAGAAAYAQGVEEAAGAAAGATHLSFQHEEDGGAGDAEEDKSGGVSWGPTDLTERLRGAAAASPPPASPPAALWRGAPVPGTPSRPSSRLASPRVAPLPPAPSTRAALVGGQQPPVQAPQQQQQQPPPPPPPSASSPAAEAQARGAIDEDPSALAEDAKVSAAVAASASMAAAQEAGALPDATPQSGPGPRPLPLWPSPARRGRLQPLAAPGAAPALGGGRGAASPLAASARRALYARPPWNDSADAPRGGDSDALPSTLPSALPMSLRSGAVAAADVVVLRPSARLLQQPARRQRVDDGGSGGGGAPPPLQRSQSLRAGGPRRRESLLSAAPAATPPPPGSVMRAPLPPGFFVGDALDSLFVASPQQRQPYPAPSSSRPAQWPAALAAGGGAAYADGWRAAPRLGYSLPPPQGPLGHPGPWAHEPPPPPRHSGSGWQAPWPAGPPQRHLSPSRSVPVMRPGAGGGAGSLRRAGPWQ